ncbi:uncharacterized protein EDB93DRAFT_1130848 [Suillus bovinus]|uniref:uncharacterized protein n=1 Tax=Suillus bovinus TaxID=48563 RepID=UPI001B885A4D|nr:uncharacterized protein EDB93DRAFT_1130848 [Suillus bovinus]KAG2155040.1 hypothetical protein EDB93DRAFT_1130848 [Suillus bovinus]
MSTWSCSSCPKSFSRKGDLTRHQLLHTGIKPHACELCPKRFAQYSGLKTHRNTHTKAKPYVCGIGTCTKAFSDPSSCTRHRKETHRREGAYKCTVPECGTRIKRRSAFVAHMKKHGIDARNLDLDAIASSANENTSQQSNFHFLPPQVADSPYCPPSETSLPGVNEDNLAHWVPPAPMPTNNYQMPVPEYDGASGVTNGMYDYSWPSEFGPGPSNSSFTPPPSVSTSHIDDFVFDTGYNEYLQPNDAFSRLPSPYASASPSLPPLLDGFVDCFGSRMRSISSSPATSSNSAPDDQLDYSLLDHDVIKPYLLFNTV